jgi:hypothetical protein
VPGLIAFAVAVTMLAATLAIAFERDLVGTLTLHGWGRTLQGIGAVMTEQRCGISGFVIDKKLDTALREGGFTDNIGLLGFLGTSFPQNLQDRNLLERALGVAQTTQCSATAGQPNTAGRYPQLLGFNGEDAGLASYTRLAFSLFGTNIPALTYAYFAIVLASLGLFAVSHGRNRGAMVAAALLTVAVFLVVCSTLFNFVIPAPFNSAGIDLKDTRFLGTIAAFPMLHLIVAWLRPDYRLGIRDYVVLCLQSVILAFALHIRTPVAWTLLALPVLWGVLTWATSRRAGDRMPRRRGSLSLQSLFLLAVACAIPVAAEIVIDRSHHPFYTAQGDLARHTFWDGALQSLEYNPEWKAKYAASVNGATSDELPLTAVRIAIARLPADQQPLYLDTAGNPTRLAYEQFSRRIFTDLLMQDPAFVLRTFFVVKPQLILLREKYVYRSLGAGLNGWHLLLPLAVLSLLGWLVGRDRQALRLLWGVAGSALLCAVIAWLPNWLVTVNELVMFDNFTWGLLFLCLAPVLLAATIGQRLPRKLPSRTTVRVLQGSRPDRKIAGRGVALPYRRRVETDMRVRYEDPAE